MTSFEENIELIDQEINKRRSRWRLSAIAWMDFSDVSQILRIHLAKKWHLYDPNKGTLPPWINSVLSSQLKNLVRNLYSSFSRPCLGCAAAEGENLCSIFTTQCNSCPLYAKWEKSKKSAYNTRLPLPLENHSQEVYDQPCETINVEKSLASLAVKLKEVLKPVEYKIFDLLFIKNLDEVQAGEKMGFKTTEKGRAAGYKQIQNLRKAIIIKAKKIIYDGEIDFN